MSTLVWLQDWFKSQCDGDWEHEKVIEITNLDNPGWMVKISLANSKESIKINTFESETFQFKSEKSWIKFWIDEEYYSAVGDVENLELLITIFQFIVEGKDLKELLRIVEGEGLKKSALNK